nr:hypothetical protein [uncultured Rhodopila sp.]
MIAHLIAKSTDDADAFAKARGWTKIGAARWATPEKDDIRVSLRHAGMALMAQANPAYRTALFVEHPDRDKFEATAAGGGLQWLNEV